MPAKRRMRPSVTVLDVERGQLVRRVTPAIPIYIGRTRNDTIETERPTRTVCGLITQSSRATKYAAVKLS